MRKSYSRTSRTVTVSSSLPLSHCALPFLLSTGWGRCTPSLLKKTIALTVWKDILKTTLWQLGEISGGRVVNIFILFDCCGQCWDKGTQRCCFCRIDSLVKNCLFTHEALVYMNLFKRVRTFQIELEFGSVSFWGAGKTRVPGEKPVRWPLLWKVEGGYPCTPVPLLDISFKTDALVAN